MAANRHTWERPLLSTISNRPGDPTPDEIYRNLGKAMSAWEGVNAATASLYLSMGPLPHAQLEALASWFGGIDKVDERATVIDQRAKQFLYADFGSKQIEAGHFRKDTKKTLSQYRGWRHRRNDIAHGFVIPAAAAPDS